VVLRLGIERSFLKLALSFSFRIELTFHFSAQSRAESGVRRQFFSLEASAKIAAFLILNIIALES